LIAHQCSHPRQWEAWEVELMKQLATQVAIAIQQSQLYNQLQQLNAQLELRVQQRTGELAIANTSLRAEIAERQRTFVRFLHILLPLSHLSENRSKDCRQLTRNSSHHSSLRTE
jgi:GAF domain-containing protein